jgi:hypothetical protein
MFNATVTKSRCFVCLKEGVRNKLRVRSAEGNDQDEPEISRGQFRPSALDAGDITYPLSSMNITSTITANPDHLMIHSEASGKRKASDEHSNAAPKSKRTRKDVSSSILSL